jgi:hypothetical protein
MEIDISKLSPEQLAEIEAKIAQKKKSDQVRREKERKAYEADRDNFVKRVHNKAFWNETKREIWRPVG